MEDPDHLSAVADLQLAGRQEQTFKQLRCLATSRRALLPPLQARSQDHFRQGQKSLVFGHAIMGEKRNRRANAKAMEIHVADKKASGRSYAATSTRTKALRRSLLPSGLETLLTASTSPAPHAPAGVQQGTLLRGREGRSVTPALSGLRGSGTSADTSTDASRSEA
jgi:hypothetical protein